MKFVLFVLTLQMTSIFAELCPIWDKGREVGRLDTSIINEASGIISSTQFIDRLYHINDSGDGPYIYMTNLKGDLIQKIEVAGMNPYDMESLAYGNCPGKAESKCLILGDIGDNAEKREQISLTYIEEKGSYPLIVNPFHSLNLKYPDRSHNAEGMAIHPNGDLFILTKEVDYDNNRAAPAQLFKLSYEDQMTSLTSKETIKTLVFRGTLDLPYQLYNYNLWGRIVTGFDISPDGKNLLILTYKAIVEIQFDLSLPVDIDFRTMKKDVDFNYLTSNIYPQQEAITYLYNGKGLLYTTEFVEDLLPEAPLKIHLCSK